MTLQRGGRRFCLRTQQLLTPTMLLLHPGLDQDPFPYSLSWVSMTTFNANCLDEVLNLHISTLEAVCFLKRHYQPTKLHGVRTQKRTT
jgi:hypothetical protein